MNVMDMPVGTIIRNKRSDSIYILGEYVNDAARELISANYLAVDYINKNIQNDYEVVD